MPSIEERVAVNLKTRAIRELCARKGVFQMIKKRGSCFFIFPEPVAFAYILATGLKAGEEKREQKDDQQNRGDTSPSDKLQDQK